MTTVREPAAASAEVDYEALGVAAARELFYKGIKAAKIDDPLHELFARAAIAELSRLQRYAPESYKEALEGAEDAAEQFNVDPLQGVSEIIQNADDLGASTIRVAVSGSIGQRDELLIAHDGEQMRLQEAWAMVLPYVSTKSADVGSKGRFGIGLKMLRRLGATLNVHSPPYHFRIENSTIWPAEPLVPVGGLYSGTHGETLLAIPLQKTFDEGDFRRWFEDWGAPSMLFLDTVRRISLLELATGQTLFDHSLEAGADKSVVLKLGKRRFETLRRDLRDPGSSARWIRYWVEIPRPPGVKRTHKATGPRTPSPRPSSRPRRVRGCLRVSRCASRAHCPTT